MFLRARSCLFAAAGAFVLVTGMYLILNGGSPVHVATGHPAGPHFVNEAGLHLSEKTIRVLCYTADPVDIDATPPRADLRVTTGDDGAPMPNLPPDCQQVAALQLLHTQPSGKPGHGPAYWIYATSWSPATPTLTPANGNITITISNTLVLYNIVASLEWQPAPSSPFVDELRTGLLNASGYLYDATEGQMAFGPVAVYVGGRGWNAADFRFRAANDYRPSAFVGGIVSDTTTYTTAAVTQTVYAPAEITLGRLWDGLSASNSVTGTWSYTNGFRTLVHEWGHYAGFLYDEYRRAQDTDGDGITDGYTETYCITLSLTSPSNTISASLMSYQYSPPVSELWNRAHHDIPGDCVGTDQWLVHAESDWDTLGHWAAIQGVTNTQLLTTSLTEGPSLGLARHLFNRWPGYLIYLPLVSRSGSAIPPVSEPTISLTLSGSLPNTDTLNALHPQVYLAKGATASSPARILYQGTTVGNRDLETSHLGQITLFDVQATDQARVFVDRYTTVESEGGRFVYIGTQPIANGGTLQVITSTWASSFDLAFDMTGPQVTTMTIYLTSSQPITAPMVQLCAPASAIGCPNNPAWMKTMQAQTTESVTWTATFTTPPPAELPDYGLLRVVAPDQEELIRWYEMAGGVGPAHIGGNAPLRDVLVMVDATQALIGARNRVIYMPAADYNALTATLPVTIHGIIGFPLDLDILLPPESLASVEQGRQLVYATDQAQTTPTPTPPPRGLSADFTAFPTAGVAPLRVVFTNTSTGSYTASLWDFGDGVTSTLEHAKHIYTIAGTYSPSLTISSATEVTTTIRPSYITVYREGLFVLTFFYSQDAVDRLGRRGNPYRQNGVDQPAVGEDQLVVLHFSRATSTWQVVPISGRSSVLNWLATVPVSEDGIYAIGWTSSSASAVHTTPSSFPMDRRR